MDEDILDNKISNKFRRINNDLLLASTSLTKSSKESSDAYLSRVTHLHMQGKKIRFIEGLEPCANLKVIIFSLKLIRKLCLFNLFSRFFTYMITKLSALKIWRMIQAERLSIPLSHWFSAALMPDRTDATLIHELNLKIFVWWGGMLIVEPALLC